jgi:hypothetical protein
MGADLKSNTGNYKARATTNGEVMEATVEGTF